MGGPWFQNFSIVLGTMSLTKEQYKALAVCNGACWKFILAVTLPYICKSICVFIQTNLIYFLEN